MGEYYAHTKEGAPESEWQTVKEHTENVARMSERFSQKFDAADWGYAVGYLHDLGKYLPAFQDKMKGKKLHVDHSTSGACWAMNGGIQNEAFGRILAYCIAGHHTGLPDGSSGTDDTCLDNRLDKGALPPYFPEIKVPALNMPYSLKPVAGKGTPPSGFSTMFFTRMLFSCLKDADCLDTEDFMEPEKMKKRGVYPPLAELKIKFDSYMNDKISRAKPSPVNNYRNRIREECIMASSKPPGLFSLTVPTGGGKTLSSMAFALEHALLNDFERIIYVIPYISIIEQTAAEFKAIFGEENVIEHHSNFNSPDGNDDYANERELRRILATDNWDAPIIVTTNVQFFESLFHNKTSRVRKIHNIPWSIVILDEAQMLPVPLLKPTIEAIKELAKNYRTSIVLCTATQPALNDSDLKGGLEDVREIIKNPKALETVFKRVFARYLGTCTDTEIINKVKSHEQMLCIVNTRAYARKIFSLLGKSDGHFHLSALMCPEHRTLVLNEIRERLLQGRRCRVISTQLVEAGVDVDFPVVYRSIAGVDSIVQSAGRCNREGNLAGGGWINVFMPETGLPKGAFKQNAEITMGVLHTFGDNLLSGDAVKAYFNDLYWRKSLGNSLDEKGILKDCETGEAILDFPFKTVAKKYQLIGEFTENILVPFDAKARRLIDSLRSTAAKGGILRKLQRYTVQVYPEQFAKLESEGYIETIDETYNVLSSIRYSEAYSEDFGLNPEYKEFLDPNQTIV